MTRRTTRDADRPDPHRLNDLTIAILAVISAFVIAIWG